MPRKTKYKELCDAYDTGVDACNNYRKECREFVQDLRTSIIETLSCPDTKIFMFQPSKGFIFKSHVIQGDAFDTEFGDNGTAIIGFALNVNNDLQDKFFTFLVIFKKIEDKFHFSIIDDDEEFVSTSDGFIKFGEHMFQIAFKNLSERLAIFLESPDEKSAPIGFRVQREKDS